MPHTFSLENTLGAGQRLQSDLATAAQGREFGSLRQTGERQRQDIQRRTFAADQKRVNTEKLLAGFQIMRQNPGITPDVLEELGNAGIINRDSIPDMLSEARTSPQTFQQKMADAESRIRLQLGQPRGQQEAGSLTSELQTFAGLSEAADLSPEDRVSAARRELGLDPRAGTVASRERVATDLELTRQVAESTADIAGATEAARQAAQIQAIPERIEAQFRSDFKAEAPKRVRAANDAISRIDGVMEEAQLAIEDIGITTTGLLGSINRRIAGTTAFALARKIDTIQANLSFDRIAEMRKNSPTGGALGQVSERELSLLGAAVVALDQANNEDEVRRAFTKVLFHYNNWKAVLTGQKDADILLQEGDFSVDSVQNNQALIEQARQAIQAGADPAAVQQRLNELGIDTSGL